MYRVLVLLTWALLLIKATILQVGFQRHAADNLCWGTRISRRLILACRSCGSNYLVADVDGATNKVLKKMISPLAEHFVCVRTFENISPRSIKGGKKVCMCVCVYRTISGWFLLGYWINDGCVSVCQTDMVLCVGMGCFCSTNGPQLALIVSLFRVMLKFQVALGKVSFSDTFPLHSILLINFTLLYGSNGCHHIFFE